MTTEEHIGDMAPLSSINDLHVRMVENKGRLLLALALVALTGVILVLGEATGLGVERTLALAAPISGLTGAAVTYYFKG